MEELDRPPGESHLVSGTADTARALVSHPLVDEIASTGRRAVGEKILRATAPGLKRVMPDLAG